jgi:hypothetical protein
VKECQTCHVRGHYSTTCPQNPNRSKAAENKAKKEVQKLKVGLKEKEAAQELKTDKTGIRKGKVKRMKHNNLSAV